LYVNDWTIELGDVGQIALQELSRRSKQIGLIPNGSMALEILEDRSIN